MRQGLFKIVLNKQPFLLTYLNDITVIAFWLNNLLASVSAEIYHIMLVSYNLQRWQAYAKNIAFIDANNADDLAFLLTVVQSHVCQKFLILIDDYQILADNEKFLTDLTKLMLRTFDNNLYLQILMNHHEKIPYRFSQMFTAIAYGLTCEELREVFGSYNQVSEKGVYKDDEGQLIGFKVASNHQIPKFRNKRTYMLKIPSEIKFKINDQGLLLGYAHRSRLPYYLKANEKCLFISKYPYLLNYFKQLFNNPKGYTFATNKEIRNLEAFPKIIWLGQGLNEQYFLNPEIKINLSNKQAYVYTSESEEVVELVNE